VDHVTDQGRSKLLLLLILLFYLLLFWATETDFLTHTQKEKRKTHTDKRALWASRGKGAGDQAPSAPHSARACCSRTAPASSRFLLGPLHSRNTFFGAELHVGPFFLHLIRNKITLTQCKQ
jgi:hypothetical protein